MSRILRIARTFSAVLLLSLAVLNTGPAVNNVYAAPCETETNILGLPTWYKYLEGDTDVPGQCRPVVNASEDALPIGLAILEIMLTLAGLIAVVMIFFGSFKYVITTGEPEKATNARKTIINALVGLAITLIAARVVSFLAERITGG